MSYWDLLVRLWRRYNLTLVVADGVKALDEAISSPDQGREADLPGPPQTEGGQEGEGRAGPPPLPRRVRPTNGSCGSPDSRLTHETFAESVPTRGSPPLLPPRPQGGPSSGPTTWPSPSTPSWRVREVPLPLEDRIARAMALNYNLSTCYLALVIILHGSLFLRETVKYIQ